MAILCLVRARLRVMAGCIRLLLVLAAPLGCSTTVITPAHVTRPATVYLLDHGITPSLVLPGRPGRMARYMYGDWEWYARGNTNAWRGALALFVPTQGTLGRDEFPSVDSAAALHQAVRVDIHELFPIQVEQDRALALRHQLDAQFEAAQTRIWNPSTRAEFVPHPKKYTYLHNSNHMMAGWLRALDCQVRGRAFYSKWIVRPAPNEHRSRR
jgi:hypothetical protein